MGCPLHLSADPVFYQPLLRDQKLNTEQWRQILTRAQQQGMTALVLQWGQYGDVRFYTADGPSAALLHALEQLQIPLWLGLYAAPDYFQQMEQPQPEKQQYFKQQLALSLQVRRYWLTVLKQQPLVLKGWYLPMELNDTDFTPLSYLHWLKQELQSVSLLIDQPLAISLYFNGKLEPTSWLSAAQQLKTDRMQIWVQDGAGAALVSETQRQQFLAMLPCTVPLIRELFRQNSAPDGIFKGRTLTASERQAKQDTCHPSVYFELRYMDAAAGLLPLTEPE
ncbi:DUF4434 domain-containing protein [Rheinheimera mesophila]|nr:DUF4434 domain-containing protein [Rheinheimera mesophila]KKL01957.1 hypothetical protein SD53_07455 [Rheinheimera mesophila]